MLRKLLDSIASRHDRPDSNYLKLEEFANSVELPSCCLDILSEMLVNPDYTLEIIRSCRPILIELSARAMLLFTATHPVAFVPVVSHNIHWWPQRWFPTLKNQIQSEEMNASNIEFMLGMFSMLLPNLPQVKAFAVHFIETNTVAIDDLLKSLNRSSNVTKTNPYH